MKKIFKTIGITLGITIIPIIAWAVQVTVPSAPGAGYMLVSSTTGNYLATSTWPLYVGSITATSTTANNIISGPIQVKAAISNHIPSDFPTTDYNIFDMSTDGQVFLNAGNDSLIGSETFMTLSDDCPTNHLGGCWSVVADDDTGSISVNINQLGMTNISGIANTTLTLGSSNNDQTSPITIIADSSKGMVAGTPVGREFDIKSEENDNGGKGGDLRLFGGLTQTAGQKMGNVLIGTSTTPFFLGIASDTPGTMLSMGSTSANFNNLDIYATSTFSKGINIKSGCFSINNVCVGSGSGTVTSVTATYPILSSGGTTPVISTAISTSSLIAVGTTSVASITTLPNLSLPSSQVTGISPYPFQLAGNATSTLTQFNGGLTAYSTSTIGNGTGTGGLTVSGNATTTLNQYIVGVAGIGTTTNPLYTLSIGGATGFNVASGTGMYTNGSATIRAYPSSNVFYAGGAGPVGAAGATPLSDVAIGDNNFQNAIIGANNDFCFGSFACNALTTGATDVAVGVSALRKATTDSEMLALGSGSLSNESGGGDDVAIGYNALTWNQSSGSGPLTGNVAAGSYAGFSLNNSNSNYNVFAGFQSAFALTNAQHNVFIGAFSGYSDGTVSTLVTGNNMTGIGYGAEVTASNSGVLGGLGANQQLWGTGTSSPYATFSIQSNLSTGDAFVVATSSGNVVAGVDNDGHEFTGGPAPAISSCGTGSGTVIGNDQSGTITTATAATACTMTFAKAYKNTPTCNVTDNSLVGFADISTISTTAVTFGISSALTAGNLYYSCSYHKK